MVEDSAQMNRIFHALSHDVRRAMLGRLALGELTIGELAEPLSMSLAAASKHVKVLEQAGLLHRTVQGRRHVCRLDPVPLASAEAWLSVAQRHGNQSLDALGDMFATDPASGAHAEV